MYIANYTYSYIPIYTIASYIACRIQLALSHSTWINIVCYDIVPDCAALQDALNLDLTTSCVIAIEYMDPRTFCSGTCSNFLHASVDACPRNVTISIGSFNQVSD